MRRIVLTIIGLVVALVHISAQDDPQYRMEIGAGVGMVSYEGDFNGNVLKNMQPMASLLWRYNFDPYKDLRLSASYGKLKDHRRMSRLIIRIMQSQPMSSIIMWWM